VYLQRAYLVRASGVQPPIAFGRADAHQADCLTASRAGFTFPLNEGKWLPQKALASSSLQSFRTPKSTIHDIPVRSASDVQSIEPWPKYEIDVGLAIAGFGNGVANQRA
jgi:hypothetical protein